MSHVYLLDKESEAIIVPDSFFPDLNTKRQDQSQPKYWLNNFDTQQTWYGKYILVDKQGAHAIHTCKH